MSSFIEFVERNYQYRRAKGGAELLICCPFCDDDTFHGSINVHKEVFQCWKCQRGQTANAKGFNAYHFLKQAHRLSAAEVFAILKGSPVQVRKSSAEDLLSKLSEQAEEDVEICQLPEGFQQLDPNSNSRLGRRAWDYFARRVPRPIEAAEQYKIGWCGSGHCAGRLVFPIYIAEELAYWQARSFFPTNMLPKYLNPSMANKPVFNLELLQPETVAIIVEGIFDVLAVGFGSVCFLGAQAQDHQLLQLAHRKPEACIVAFDPDEAGRQGAERLLIRLASRLPRTRLYKSNLKKDPASLGSKARKIILKKAQIWEQHLKLF